MKILFDKMNDDKTRWDELTDLVVSAAKEVCGTEEKKVENPWMVGREDENSPITVKLTDFGFSCFFDPA